MTNRRTFLKSTAAFAAGSIVLPMVSCSGTTQNKIGLQLYTVRDKLNQDLDGTLNRLAEIGYNSMEAAGYSISDGTFYGMTPAAFSEKLIGLGMPLDSSHTVFEPEDAEKVFTDAKAAGCQYVIYPYLPEEFRQDIDGYKATAEKFNRMGEIANKYDIRFGYHNHAFEFEEMNGQMGMNVLMDETIPELVTIELDLYWIARAGYDPAEYMKQYPGRFELWHVKDMVKSEDMFFAPVGTGRMNFESIFAAKEVAGMKQFFVEQDSFKDLDSLESAEISYNYLSNASFV